MLPDTLQLSQTEVDGYLTGHSEGKLYHQMMNADMEPTWEDQNKFYGKLMTNMRDDSCIMS